MSADSVSNKRLANLAYVQALGWFLFGILFYFSDQLDRTFNLWFLIVPILLLPLLILLITAVISLVFATYKHLWRRCISILVAPIFFVISLLPGKWGYNSDWLRFQFTESHYKAIVANNSSGDHVWDWGQTGGVAAANIFHSLVYDETPHTLQTELSTADHSITVRSMGNNFYLVTEIYQ